MTGPTQRRLLIVDDEPPILFALGEYFTTLGFAVDTASELEGARRLLERHRYALVITDLRLSGTTGTEGFELVSWLRARSPRVSIVLLTGYGSPEIEQQAHDLGVDVFLQKPIALAAVADIADRLIATGAQP
jgi:DNA-binding response OmpR family regulator